MLIPFKLFERFFISFTQLQYLYAISKPNVAYACMTPIIK